MGKVERQLGSSPKRRLLFKDSSEVEEPNAKVSTIISFVENLEDDSSKFYENMAERFVDNKETFLAFAKEGRKSKVLVLRTY